jgi:hypothetical protein
MEFLNGILVEVSGHKLKSSQTRVFVWFSTTHVSVLQSTIHEQTRVILFRGFFVSIFKTREEYVVL